MLFCFPGSWCHDSIMANILMCMCLPVVMLQKFLLCQFAEKVPNLVPDLQLSSTALKRL